VIDAKREMFPRLFTATTTKPPNTEPLARKADPRTSHKAAAAYTASGQRVTDKRKVVTFLKIIGPSGLPTRPLTAHEITRDSGLPHPTVHKRLADARRDGLLVNDVVRTCSVTGRASLTWRAV